MFPQKNRYLGNVLFVGFILSIVGVAVLVAIPQLVNMLNTTDVNTNAVMNQPMQSVSMPVVEEYTNFIGRVDKGYTLTLTDGYNISYIEGQYTQLHVFHGFDTANLTDETVIPGQNRLIHNGMLKVFVYDEKIEIYSK